MVALLQVPQFKKRSLSHIQWSSYQQALFDWALNDQGHALVSAVAGAGKTLTLEGLVDLIPRDQKIAALAFNSHMAAALKHRLPTRVTVSTIHRMGCYILRRHLGQPFECNESKYQPLARDVVQQLRSDLVLILEVLKHSTPALTLKQLEREARSFLQEIVHCLQVTLAEPTETEIRHLIHHFGLEPPAEPLLKLLLPWPAVLLDIGKTQALEQLNIGFDDLLWLPHILNLRPKPKDWVLVDEAQDLSRAQLQLLLKLPSATGRMIFVGDPNQAIFGFAGADAESWQRIRERLHPKEFPLSLTYRCPHQHVAIAAHLVPQIQALPAAQAGDVQVIHPTQVKDRVQVGDLVLCRFTAPLISLCLKLVTQQRIPARVRGKEISKLLTSLVKEIADRFPREFIAELRDYVKIRTELHQIEGKTSALELLKDRARALEICFETFGMACETVAEFCRRIEELFDDEAAQSQHVILATIHKAKGDEADRVFILKSDCLPSTFLAETPWQQQQEINLLYVALTRSKRSLFLVPMPKKGEHLAQLLEDPLGGIQLPHPSTQENSPSDFEIELKALHHAMHKLLMDLIQVAQEFQKDYPRQMEVVWRWMRADPDLLNSGVPLAITLGDRLPAQHKRTSPLRSGDVCRYSGPPGALNVSCGKKELQVVNVTEEMATVVAPNWSQPVEIPTRHLRRQS